MVHLQMKCVLWQSIKKSESKRRDGWRTAELKNSRKSCRDKYTDQCTGTFVLLVLHIGGESDSSSHSLGFSECHLQCETPSSPGGVNVLTDKDKMSNNSNKQPPLQLAPSSADAVFHIHPGHGILPGSFVGKCSAGVLCFGLLESNMKTVNFISASTRLEENVPIFKT